MATIDLNSLLDALHRMQFEIVKNTLMITRLDWEGRKINRYSMIAGVGYGIDEFATELS